MKNTFRHNRHLPVELLWGLLLCLTGTTLRAQQPEIKIVYPKADQIVHATDSTFVFGHLPQNMSVSPKDIVLLVNGHWTEVHKDGGFLAFVPVLPGAFSFDIRAYREKELVKQGVESSRLLASGEVSVVVAQPLPPLSEDTLRIIGDYRPPSGDLVLTKGERLEVMFRGTPGMNAWFTIPGVLDSVPMTEVAPRSQPYWGESVFGVGAVPDSLLMRGIYSGSCEIPAGDTVLDWPIVYNLAPPGKHRIFLALVSDSSDENRDRLKQQLRMPDQVSAESAYRVSLNHPEYPFTVRLADSVQIVRHGPRRGYFSIFQPQGVEALVVGAEGAWYKAQLAETQFAWISKSAVERLEQGIVPPRSLLRSVRTYASDDRVRVEFPLSGKHAFRVIEDDKRTVRILLFGVTSDTDWIRYDFSDPIIDLATWNQPEPGLYECIIRLTSDVWGYDTFYRGNTLCLELMRPPDETWRLRNKRIVIDPGHSSDPGAIGPTEMTEAEANLGIALVLRHMLKAAGAEVIMTRDDNSHVALYDRPMIAKLGDADLFVSVHNNALPDGVNPYTNHGVSTYYYHPHSIELARAIQGEILAATDMPSHGLYHGNLAVNRPTQYPAVLVECAFMIIPEQEAMLKTYAYRKKVAGAIMRGIEKFLKEYDDGN